MQVDIHIDPFKLEQVLYNNEDLVLGNLINNNDVTRISDDDRGGQRSRNGGLKVRVVVGDVVSSRRNVYQGQKKLKKDSGEHGKSHVIVDGAFYIQRIVNRHVCQLYQRISACK